jgi:RNA polymerase sigma factor (sigma-70 family)
MKNNSNFMTDQEIVEGLRQKERLSYERTSVHLWKTFAPKVLGMVLKNNGSREDAHDLFADAFIKVQKKVVEGSYQHQNQFAGYFMTVAKRAWLDELRRRASDRRRTWEKLDSEDDYLQLLDAGEADIVEYVLFNEKWSKIHQIWQKWDDSICKTRLTLFHLDGKTMREIAGLQGLTEENMRQRILHCRQRFRLLVNRLRG